MAIERSERLRLRRPPSRRPVLQAASVALLAGALVAYFVGRDIAKHGNAPEKTQAASPVAPAPLQPVRAEGSASRPLIEEIRNPGARVYQFAAASPKEPNVVFVANPNADL